MSAGKTDGKESSMKTGMRILPALAIGWVVLCGAGCSRTEKWKEEVELSDGRVIVVERETLHEGGGDEWASNRSGTKPKERRIRFSFPEAAGQVIEWRSTKNSAARWPEQALVLDIEAGHPIVFATISTGECNTYYKYIYRNGLWSEEALPIKFDVRKTNLLIRDGREMPQFVNLEDKRKKNADVRYLKPLKQVGPTRENCR